MLYIIGLGLIILGLIAIFSGIVGLFRLPDFYTKLHASGVIESCGVPLCLVGLICLQHNFINSFKLCFASLLILLLTPVSTYAIGKAALLMKTKAYSPAKRNKSDNK